jgi:hypothetical protein
VFGQQVHLGSMPLRPECCAFCLFFQPISSPYINQIMGDRCEPNLLFNRGRPTKALCSVLDAAVLAHGPTEGAARECEANLQSVLCFVVAHRRG